MTTAVECVSVQCVYDAAEFESPKGCCGSTMEHVRRSMRHVQRLSWKQLAYCVFCVMLVLFGSAGQVVVLNLWLNGFPASANAPFTVLLLSTTTSLIIYSVGLLVWCVIRRPSLAFLLSWKAFFLELADGATGGVQGLLLVSATQYTPELLQAFLLSTAIVWTFLFMKLVFKEDRSYCSPLVIASFVLSLGGLLVGSASKFSGTGMTTSAWCWTAVFAISMIPGALGSVVAAKFMRHFTLPDGEPVEPAKAVEPHVILQLQPECLKTSSSPLLGNASYSAPQGTDSATAKGVRMVWSTLVQTIILVLLFPTSALPWFGAYSSVSESAVALGQGVKCTFNMLPGCEGELVYFIIFNVCFASANVGAAVLNYYSPAMTSMVGQLISPLTAVVLMIFPALNVAGQAFNVPESIFAVLFIAAGAVLYTVWEESTGHAGPDQAASPTAPVNAPHTPR